MINTTSRDVVKTSTFGGCRDVLTNFSYNFDQVVEMFPENVVDGGGVKQFSGLT
jgi:hypothetical protein